jgi:hypothetical protein
MMKESTYVDSKVGFAFVWSESLPGNSQLSVIRLFGSRPGLLRLVVYTRRQHTGGDGL